jgi:glycosyltransferase involved in cell wall biosynthesis
VLFVEQPNRGPGSARNTGVDLALRSWPAVEAVFFLDADNRLRPNALRNALHTLRSDPGVGWVFPDLDMFGIDHFYSTAGAYSLLEHAFYNYCDTGSLISRRVINTGVRFDESPLVAGYEDWDFWLEAARLGFRGKYCSGLGLLYRVRGDSFLREAARNHDAITAYLRKKHEWLYRASALVDLEHREAPRFEIHLKDTAEVIRTTDPRRRHAVDRREPRFVVYTTNATLEALDEQRTTVSAFWHLERALYEGHAAAHLHLRPTNHRRVSESSADGAPAMIMREREHRQGPAAAITFAGPAGLGLPPLTQNEPARIRNGTVPSARWRKDPVDQTRELCNSGPIAPITGDRNIGFLLPMASFGGVERVAENYAREFRRAGWNPHLFVVGSDKAELLPEFQNVFETIHVVPRITAAPAQVLNQNYLGTPVTDWMSHGDHRQFIGLLATMNVVVNTHHYEANAVMASLRRLGVRTYTALHIVDRLPNGMPYGLPHTALVYEHAYDGIIVISQQMRAWCIANGIPESKIVHIPNAASYSLPDPPPIRPSREGPIRALFLGRLDPQKGLGRLTRVIRATTPAIQWRVVGSAMFGEASDAVPLKPWLHEPARTPEQLTEHYSWADVLVLTSDFEGVPLTMLEASRLGCVPIAMRVGAVEEAAPGIFCDSEEQLIMALKNVTRDDLRQYQNAPVPSWTDGVAPFIRMLEAVE